MLDVDDSIVRENTDLCYYVLSYTKPEDQHTSIQNTSPPPEPWFADTPAYLICKEHSQNPVYQSKYDVHRKKYSSHEINHT